MRDIIILRSRDGTKNYLKKLPKGEKTYLLKSELDTVRVGEGRGGFIYIDLSGGPFIAKGAYLEEADAVVKSIDHLQGQGFTITFE